MPPIWPQSSFVRPLTIMSRGAHAKWHRLLLHVDDILRPVAPGGYNSSAELVHPVSLVYPLSDRQFHAWQCLMKKYGLMLWSDADESGLPEDGTTQRDITSRSAESMRVTWNPQWNLERSLP